MKEVAELPYFEGDFWPNVYEENIKELNQELEKRQKEEEEATNDTDDGETNDGNSTEVSNELPYDTGRMVQRQSCF